MRRQGKIGEGAHHLEGETFRVPDQRIPSVSESELT